jgi:hypothetical protein
MAKSMTPIEGQPKVNPRKITPAKNQRTKVKIASTNMSRSRRYMRGNLIQTRYILNVQRQGFNKKTIGQSWAEQRAIPASMVKGTIYERIVYKALMETFRLVPGIDFDLHSAAHSSAGASIPGMVLPIMKIAIVIQGPGADSYAALRKDSELRMTVESHGYEVFELTQDQILDEFELDKWLETILGFNHGGGLDASHDTGDTTTLEATGFPQIEQSLNNLETDVLGALNA